MLKKYRLGAALMLSCCALTACQVLPRPESIASSPTLDPDRIKQALPFCPKTLDGVNSVLGVWASPGTDALRNSNVVRAVIHGINKRRAIALRAILMQNTDEQVADAIATHGLGRTIGPGSAAEQKAKLVAQLDRIIEQDLVGRLTVGDFTELYGIMRTRAGEIGNRVVQYEAAYVSGEFVDRFGAKWEAPKPSWKVSDDQISEALTVMLEALADEIFQDTPVWYRLPSDKGKPPAEAGKTDAAKGDGRVYFPGGKAELKPTFIALMEDGPRADSLQWKMDAPKKPDDAVCGMTELKIKALLALSNKASTLAAGQSGLILGSFGGTSIGLPIVMGKLSIGDNQTLQAMFKAIVAYIAKRGAYEASWHLLLHIDEGRFGKYGGILGDIVLGDETGKVEKTAKPKS